jgi:hypothetical protein
MIEAKTNDNAVREEAQCHADDLPACNLVRRSDGSQDE